MRILSVTLWCVAVLFAGLWIVAYIYIGALGCAFAGPQAPGNCDLKMPWQLGFGEFVVAVLIPLAILAGLVTAAVLVGRVASKRAREQ